MPAYRSRQSEAAQYGGQARARRLLAEQAAERERNAALEWRGRRCKSCLAPIVGLGHKRYCSDACKMRAARRRTVTGDRA